MGGHRVGAGGAQRFSAKPPAERRWNRSGTAHVINRVAYVMRRLSRPAPRPNLQVPPFQG